MNPTPKSPPATTTEPAGPPSRWWVWIVAAFAVQFAVWIAWFIVAAHHPVEEIPVPPRVAK